MYMYTYDLFIDNLPSLIPSLSLAGTTGTCSSPKA